MKPERILITGGAGFIGSHLADALVADGYTVRLLDALVHQVHGARAERPSYLSPYVELLVGDVSDIVVFNRAVQGIDAVVHFAASVGVAQSMYEIASYVRSNSQGTANLLQILSERRHRIRKLVVASSMSVYGEGAYRCAECGPCVPPPRNQEQLVAKQWELRCPHCSGIASPVLTPEDKRLAPRSIYAITKRDQEEMCLCVGQAYAIPTVAFRFFNVYGERQSLSNPYTGIAAIFSSRLLNNEAPLIYEDGAQTRDFIHVSDIVQAVMLAIRRPEADCEVFNVGTGQPTTVAEVASVLGQALRKPVAPQLLHSFRMGDIRHCVADISRITKALGYKPKVAFTEGMKQLVQWISNEHPDDRVAEANARLRERGLVL